MMTPEQAAAKAFRDCRLNHDKSRKVASYMARQHLMASGAKSDEAASAMGQIDKLLDEWFANRKQNKSFTPNIATQVAKSDGQKQAGNGKQ